MRRTDLEHVVRAAADLADEEEIVVVGSQAVLATVDEAPSDMVASLEADVYPARDPQKGGEIEGTLGDGSQFHRENGYYAHAVGPETIVGPSGWESRLVRMEVPPRAGSDQAPVALCMEIHDLVVAKCAAGRARDWEFAESAVRAGLVEPDRLLEMAGRLEAEPDRVVEVEEMLRGVLARASRSGV
jgi:hypothetical protein